MDSSAPTVGPHLEDLVVLLHDHYKVDLICVCQTLRRSSSEAVFNKNVILLTKYFNTVLEPIPYAFFWSHRGFWNTKSQFLSRDGVNLHGRGQHKLYRSMTRAALKCLRLLDNNQVPIFFLNAGQWFRDSFIWLCCVRSFITILSHRQSGHCLCIVAAFLCYLY